MRLVATGIAFVGLVSTFGIVGVSTQQPTSDQEQQVRVEVIRAVKTTEEQPFSPGGSIRQGKMHWKVGTLAAKPEHAFAVVELAFENLVADSLTIRPMEILTFTTADGDTINSKSIAVKTSFPGGPKDVFFAAKGSSFALGPSERKSNMYLLTIPQMDASISVQQAGDPPIRVELGD